MINYLTSTGKRLKNEILKHLSLKELEEAIKVKKTELKDLVSTEGCMQLIAKELGIKFEYIQEKGVIEEFEKINKELLKDVEGLSQRKWTIGEMSDTTYLMNVVGEILQFLEHKFPNALSIDEIPIQRIIFQNARYRLYKRMNNIREKK